MARDAWASRARPAPEPGIAVLRTKSAIQPRPGLKARWLTNPSWPSERRAEHDPRRERRLKSVSMGTREACRPSSNNHVARAPRLQATAAMRAQKSRSDMPRLMLASGRRLIAPTHQRHGSRPAISIGMSLARATTRSGQGSRSNPSGRGALRSRPRSILCSVRVWRFRPIWTRERPALARRAVDIV
jgi:hypothetical protein